MAFASQLGYHFGIVGHAVEAQVRWANSMYEGPGIFMDDFARSARADRLFAACGRALVLAARFEAGCRAVFAMADIAADPGRILGTPDGVSELAATLRRKQLGGYIAQLGKAFKDDELESVLNAAREARNEVAHELALGLDYSLADGDEERKVLARLQRVVLPLAEADKLLSGFLTALSGEPFPTFLSNYSRLLEDWVCTLDPERAPN